MLSNSRIDRKYTLLNLRVIATLLIAGIMSLYAQQPDWEWTVSSGGSKSDFGYKLAIDNAGNTYVAGYFYQTTILGGDTLLADNDEILLLKYSVDGDMLWYKSLGGIFYDRARDLELDNDGNIILTGYFTDTVEFGDTILQSAGQTDMFLSKISPDGDMIWTLQEGGIQSELGNAVTVGSDNRIYVAGILRGSAQIGDTLLTSQGAEDIFIAVYDTHGEFIRAIQGKNTDSASPVSIAVDSQDNIIVGGVFYTSLNINGSNLFGSGESDGFISKLSNEGSPFWSKKVAGNSYDYVYELTVDNSDNIISAGYFSTNAFVDGNLLVSNGVTDAFITKHLPDGTLDWVNSYGDTGIDGVISVATDESGVIYTVGEFTEFIQLPDTTLQSRGSSDIILSALDGTGDYLWTIHAGGNSRESGSGIAIRDGAIRYTGIFYQTTTHGDTTVNSNGLEDIFLSAFQLPSITGLEDYSTTPQTFQLGQNYPNPFNPSTRIPFVLQNSSRVTLEIFDVLGRRVRTLIDDKQFGAGNHLTSWNGKNDSGDAIATGVYTYRLIINHTESIQKKMIFLK